jgi:hypothetical protein
VRPVVIFSSDSCELYRPFVEPVVSAWKNMGFDVMCEIIDENNHYVSEDLIPYGNQSQMVRALVPALYPDRTFIISDVDMLPLNKSYFHSVVELVDSDRKIVNVSADAYPGKSRFPMCYFAGMGSAFSIVNGVTCRDDIGRVMIEWWNEGMGWDTDEVCFTRSLLKSNSLSNVEMSLHNRGWVQGNAVGRIDRGSWVYDQTALLSGGYIDSHMLRPFGKYREKLAPLFQSVGVSI